MASASIQLGGTLDIASGAEVAALGTSIDNKLESLMRRDPKPIMRTIPSNPIQGLSAGGPVYANLGGPASGKVWYIRQLLAVLADPFTSQGVATVNAAAAAGSSLTLPPGAVLTGLNITSAGAAAAPVTGAVTIAGGTGGTQTTQYVFTANGTVVALPEGLSPAVPNTGQIVITMPAVTGGTAYTMTATYAYPIAWYIAFSNAGDNQIPNVGLTELLVPGVQTLPSVFLPGDSDGLFVHFGEHVICQVNGLALGQSSMALIRVSEYVDSAEEARRM